MFAWAAVASTMDFVGSARPRNHLGLTFVQGGCWRATSSDSGRDDRSLNGFAEAVQLNPLRHS